MRAIRKQGKSALAPHTSVKSAIPELKTAANKHRRWCCFFCKGKHERSKPGELEEKKFISTFDSSVFGCATTTITITITTTLTITVNLRQCFSSESSAQLYPPSQRKPIGIHSPLSHWNLWASLHSSGGAAQNDVMMTLHNGRHWPGWGGVLGVCMNGGIMFL